MTRDAQKTTAFVRQRRKTRARLIAKIWREHPELCPNYGKRMKVNGQLNLENK